MKRNYCKLLLSAGLVLLGLVSKAQGLQGVVVENYHTTTQADADYYNGLGNGSGTMTAGLVTYRVYIDMAPGYKLNTVFGSASNVLDITSTSVFWNDDGFGTQFPPQTSRHDDGSAFDSWVTIGRASRSGGAAGCTSSLEQLGVPRVSDTNGNLTMCNLWSGFGPADNDGNVPGASADPTLVGISAANLAPFIDVDGGSAFTTTGSWALLPPLDGPEAAGDNRVLIGQFSTAGTFSFKINISLQTPQQTVEFYTHTSSESGSAVSAFLTYPVACTPVQITSTSSNSPICSNQTLNLGVVATGTAPINYTWTGAGTITNGGTANATVTGAATGNYNIAVSNGCGSLNQNVAVVVNTATNWYADTDGDGFGAGAATLACAQPGGSVANNTDLCPTDANKQAPGACGCGVADVPATYYADTDGDGFGAGAPIAGFTCISLGVTNNTDLCPTDANKQAPGACGCGVADVPATYYADTDGDGFGAGPAIPGFTCIVLGVTNNTDNCPTVSGVIGSTCNDGNQNTTGDVINANCVCEGSTVDCNDNNPCTIDSFNGTICVNTPGPDGDGDGTCDLIDGCPNDANKIAPGACGCGVADVPATYYADTDGDGFGAGPAIPGFTCIVLGVTNNTDNCPTVSGVIGSTCDDGNQNTNGDVINANCVCEGSSVDCNDNNPCTIDSFNGTICVNTPGPDGDGDGTCDLIDGCPNDANKIAPGACGCGVADVPATYYADTDGDGFGAGAPIAGFTCNVLGVTNNTDNCPSIVGVIGSTCNDGNSNTSGDVINANCQCVGTPIGGGCVLNQLELVVETDGSSNVSYEVRIQGSGAIALSGALPVAAGTYTESLCLANGCYYLRVLDNGGDGITGGGYVLSTLAGTRIIDDRDNFTTGNVSAIANNEGFCLPLGADKLVGTSCDKLDWVNGDYIVASANPAVSSQWLVGGQTDDGYEFWFFNPNGGYSFRKFRNHATSDGFGPASATRACHLKINNWAVAQQIPATTLMNVRIRSRVNGVNSAWGATCTFKIDPVRAQCPLTKLNDIPGTPALSCGATRAWGSGNYVYARPVTGATQYQFRFRKDNEGFVAIRTATTYFVQLNWITNPLQNGKTYQVEVRAFKNGAWCIDATTPAPAPNFLPWGVACSLTIDNTPVSGGNQNSTIENTDGVELRMYPNPNRGDQLFLSLDAVEVGVTTVSVDIYDLFGKRVSARTIAVNDSFINTVLDLDGNMASGMYVVNITAGTASYTERLVIQK